MYVQIAVPSFRAPNVDSFTYEIPEGLKVRTGQLVIVPFGRNKVYGVVLSTISNLQTTAFQIKPITSIVIDQPFLLPYQLKLLKLMNEYYLATLNNCLEGMLPELPKTQSKVDPCQYLQQGSTLNQTLVLVPTINHLPKIMASFPSAKNYTTFTSEQKPKEKFAKWLQIKTGGFDYIFGSRSAVFAPCPNLKKIIIFDEHDDSYKDQKSPYYDTLTVAEMISNLTGAKIEIVDSSPKVTTFFQAADSRFHLVDATRKNLSQPQTRIVSMIEEKLTDNKTPISNYLRTLLERAQQKNLNCLLFLNKKQESGNLYCRACRTEQRLPKEPEVCPHCGSKEFWFYSLNINTLAKLVKKQIQGARVSIISGNKYPITNNQYQIPNIDIATAGVFYRLIEKRYALVANISTDSPLNVTDYVAAERAYAQITNLKKLATKVLILQTYNQDNPVIIQAAKSNYKSFANSQLAQRKALSYPPYSLLVKLVLKGKVRETLERKAEKLASDLRSNLSTMNHQPLTILGPFAPFFSKSTLRYNIVIKVPTTDYKLETRLKITRELTKILKPQQADQLIVEPDTLN